MCVFNNFYFWTDILDDCISHVFIVGAGVAYWISFGNAGTKDKRFCTALNHELSSGDCSFAWTASASNESNNFNRAGFFKSKLAFSGNLKTVGAWTDVLYLLTSDDSNLFHLIFLLF